MSNSSLVNVRIPSPNYSSREGYRIDRITIHHMAGNLTVETCGNVFAPKSRQASSHYGIGTDGRVGQYVDEAYRAWTSSSRVNDRRAVTIEVADNKIGNGWGSSAAAMSKLVLLCADICRRNGIPKLVYNGTTSGNLTLHKWFVSTDCPGAYLESQMPKIANEVNELLRTGGTSFSWDGKTTYSSAPSASANVAPEAKGYLCSGDVGNAVKDMQKKLIACGYSCGASGVDGSFGPATVAAVQKFQKDRNLEVDGCFGPITKKTLEEVYKAKQTGTAISTTSKITNTTNNRNEISVDGSWGQTTTRKAQQIFKTTVDGKISRQPKGNQKYLPNAHTSSWEFKSSYTGGSALIKAIQKKIGASADGYFGPASVKAFQKWLGVRQDGSMGPATVKAFQRWLNNN